MSSKFQAVYNMKDNRFFAPSIPTLAEFTDELVKADRFLMVGDTIEADTCEDVYRILNMDIPEDVTSFVHEIAEADPFHVRFPSLHSSMSCGDFLIEYNDAFASPLVHICDSCGWAVLV